jgi:hypothetical protein
VARRAGAMAASLPLPADYHSVRLEGTGMPAHGLKLPSRAVRRYVANGGKPDMTCTVRFCRE